MRPTAQGTFDHSDGARVGGHSAAFPKQRPSARERASPQMPTSGVSGFSADVLGRAGGLLLVRYVTG